MTVLEITNMANLHTGQRIDLVYSVRYINEGMRKIVARYKKSAGVSATHDIECTDINTEFTLPTDRLLQIKKIVYINDDGSKFDYNKYSLFGNVITFSDTGTYKVYYDRMPNNVTNTSGSDTPEINELYHNALVMYLASRELERINKEPQKASSLLAEFETECSLINKTLTTGNRRQRGVIKAQYWR